MSRPLRFGVLGASARIHRKRLRPAFHAAASAEVVAEASRRGGDDTPYRELLARDDVDAVYLPLPNALHAPWIGRALEAGKHVLCEKPLTMDPADTDALFDAAASSGRVLVEAYMWPHHPRAKLILELSAADLGTLRHLHSAFTYPLRRPGDHRVDERGGGAVFDVGIYCVAPAMLLAGSGPVAVTAHAVHNEWGIDVSTSGLIDWGGGFTSTFEVSFECPERRTLTVSGTGGFLSLEGEGQLGWHTPGPEVASTVRVDRADGSVERYTSAGANAFSCMIEQFVAVVAGGEEPVFGPAESRRLARVLDAVRRCGAGGAAA